MSLEFQANMRLGVTATDQGSYHQGREFFERNQALLQEFPAGERFGLAGLARVLNAHRWMLGLAETGDFGEGMTRAAEAVRLAEAVDHVYSRAHAYSSTGYLHLRRGDLPAALTVLERGVALCPSDTVPIFFIYMSAALGYAYALSDRCAEATSLLDQSLARATSIGLLVGQSLRMTWLGETHRLAGRADDAVRCCRRALELARHHRERGHEAWGLLLLSDLAAACNPPEAVDADRYYREARILAGELGMRPLVAHCHLGLARLARRTGDRLSAAKYLATAITLYREMGMQFWLSRAEMMGMSL